MERGCGVRELARDSGGDLETALEVGGGVGGDPGDDDDVTDMLDGEVKEDPCVAILTRPRPDRQSVYTRLPGDGLAATRHPGRFRGNTAAPGGQRRKEPGPERNDVPRGLVGVCFAPSHWHGCVR